MSNARLKLLRTLLGSDFNTDPVKRMEDWIARQERRLPQPHAPARPLKRERPVCGARTRKGTPCKRRCHWPKGAKRPAKRCANHGGMSTGPKTFEGKVRAASNLGLAYDAKRKCFYKPK